MKGAKDMISADREPGVVYALGCMECPRVYIGETARTAKQRVKEHNMHTRTGYTDLSRQSCTHGRPSYSLGTENPSKGEEYIAAEDKRGFGYQETN